MRAKWIFILLAAGITLANCQGNPKKQASNLEIKNSNLPVTIYYFHGEHRCPTCLAVEKEARITVEMDLSNEVESGRVKFEVINADDPKNKELCEKYEIYGSTLLLVKGGKTVNLTNMAFTKARIAPDEFREELVDEVKKLSNV